MLNDFRKLMVARFFFTLGVQMQAVLIGWRMYDLTRDPLALGIVGLVEAIPALTLALYAGYLVDRSRPILVYRLVVVGSLVSGLILLFSQTYGGGLSVGYQIVLLYASSFTTGLARGFTQPAMYSIVPRLIPRDQTTQASAWMTTTLQVARISGPALGGLIFGFAGIVPAAIAVCVSLVITSGALAIIRTRIPTPPPPENPRPLGEELLSGARFVYRHPILFPALMLDMVSVLFGGVTALLPIYAAEILAVGPKGLGLLRGAPAFGAAFMSIALTRIDVRARAGRHLFGAVGAFGLCILVFSISRDFWLSFAALAFSGAFDSVSMVIRGAAVQLSSPPAMRGRIASVNAMFIGSSNELGEFESGVAAKLLGTVPAAVFGAGVCLLTVAVTAWKSPRLRRLNLHELTEPT